MIRMLDKKELWNAGYVEQWDFSQANSTQELREEAVSLVGGACRNVTIQNPKKFYEKLLTEHNGKPSEIFQFLPIKAFFPPSALDSAPQLIVNEVLRFGYLSEDMFYSNARTLQSTYNEFDFSEDCNKFVVFRIKIPYMIVDHLRRHKMLSNMIAENWQSNRSVHLKEWYSTENLNVMEGHIYREGFVRPELVNKGEFGLRYVTGWIGGWLNDPMVWDNFFGVRLQKPTQKETMELARVMYKMMQKNNNYELEDF